LVQTTTVEDTLICVLYSRSKRFYDCGTFVILLRIFRIFVVLKFSKKKAKPTNVGFALIVDL